MVWLWGSTSTPGRFQGGYSQKGLGVGVAIYDGAPDDFIHELNVASGNVHPDSTAVGQAIGAVSFWRQSDTFQVLPWHETVDCSGVHQERPFPDPVGFRRVSDLHGLCG